MSDHKYTPSSHPRDGGRFTKGNRGGPGRPRKSVSRSALALDEIGAEASESIVRALVDKACRGDLRAMEMVLSRVWPHRSGRPLEVPVPPVAGVKDYVPAVASVARSVLEGSVTPAEGRALTSMIDAQVRGITAFDHEQRLYELEKEKPEPFRPPYER